MMHLERKSCKLIAHRGYSGIAPENTIPAFKLASEAGYDGIECDIHVTKDNQLIIFHDSTLDRMTGVSGFVMNLNYPALKMIHITTGANIEQYPKLEIPLLEDYLSICQRNQLIPVIEIKEIHNLHNLDEVISKIREYKLYQMTYIISFNKEYLIYLREQYKDLKIQYLVGQITSEVIGVCKKFKLDVDSNYKHITKSIIDRCHKEGILVNVWTVDDFKTAQKLINAGVDFLTTNRLN